MVPQSRVRRFLFAFSVSPSFSHGSLLSFPGVLWMPWPQAEPDYFAYVTLFMLLPVLPTFSLLSHIALLIEWLLMTFGYWMTFTGLCVKDLVTRVLCWEALWILEGTLWRSLGTGDCGTSALLPPPHHCHPASQQRQKVVVPYHRWKLYTS